MFSVATKLLRGVPGPLLLAIAAGLQMASVETHWTLVDEFCGRWVYFLAGYLLAPAIFGLASSAVMHKLAAFAGLAIWALVNGFFALTRRGRPGSRCSPTCRA